MHALIGYAIVSADDKIADAKGHFPDALRNEVDWAYFQSELDKAYLVVLGRLSHEAAMNVRGRRRLVISSEAHGLQARNDGWWLNPADMPLGRALDAIVPANAIVAVPGGQSVFDLVGPEGFSAFHLTRATKVQLRQGRGLFSACDRGVPADAVLAKGGLVARETELLDPATNVTLTVWERPGTLRSV